jgi:histidyl-tRNA synthetase
VWRAERPQKGRYRQFVQCDIDIIGEPGAMAEIELISATSAVLERLGVAGATIRINDRRVLLSLLGHWQVPIDRFDQALVIIDKLDKIGVDGVVGELGEIDVPTDGLAEQLSQLQSADWSIGDDAPAWLDTEAFADLVALREAIPGATIEFAPTLVRGMGYYTGTIFEVAHPDFGYSLGGGGRYDGMIGRFLGQDVPAVGFSLGFERLVDLVTMPDAATADAVVLVYDRDVTPAALGELKRAVMADHARVRLERRTKNMKNLLAGLAEQGFTAFASVSSDTAVENLEFRPLT